MGGLRATLAVEGAMRCPLTDLGTDEARHEMLARANDGDWVHEEFRTTDADVTGAPGVNNIEEVYTDDKEHVYRFEREQRDCPCESVEAGGCPVVKTTVADDTVHVTLHAPSTDVLKEIIDGLNSRDATVNLKRITQAGSDGNTLTIKRPLTARQRELLSLAVERGYYDSPRECTLTELAEAAGVSPSSASATLQRAEGSVVKQFLDP